MPRTSTAIAREFALIRRSLRQLATSFSRIGPILSAPPRIVYMNIDGRPRKKPHITPELRAAFIVKGRYMGTMRNLSATKRAMVKRIRVEKGVRAAIAAARKMAPYMTKVRRAELKLHGQYIGTIRSLPAAKRSIVKKIRAAKGVRAAIAEARRLAS